MWPKIAAAVSHWLRTRVQWSFYDLYSHKIRSQHRHETNVHISGLGGFLPEQSARCRDICHADKPEANTGIIRHLMCCVKQEALLFFPLSLTPCLAPSSFLSAATLSGTDWEWRPQSADQLTKKKTSFRRLLKHLRSELRGHPSRRVQAWLKVLQERLPCLLLSVSAVYHRLWETFSGCSS